MKPVCQALGVARSHIVELMARPTDWSDGRTTRQIDPIADLALVDALRSEIGELPTYGYRRAGALVNRRRLAAGLALFNHKRIYRLYNEEGLSIRAKLPRRKRAWRYRSGRPQIIAPNDVWAASSFVSPSPNVWHFDGSTWTSMRAAPSRRPHG